MKVFLSWSGETSKRIAIALHDWLPSVIQAIVPWMSSEDIAKGARWSAGIANELKAIGAGIVCVTPDNMTAPWLNFEAGALSKTVDNQEMVCTYLFRVKQSDVTGPLSQFQHSLASKEDTGKLIATLNKAMNEKALTEVKLAQYFDRWWPDLEKILNSIPETTSTNKPARSQEEMIEEMLGIVREQARTTQLIYEMGLAEKSNKSQPTFYYSGFLPNTEMLGVNQPHIPQKLNSETFNTLLTDQSPFVKLDFSKKATAS
jgi:hypothetical protein